MANEEPTEGTSLVPKFDRSTVMRAARRGFLAALGTPGIVLGASFVGFGSLAQSIDMTLFQGVLTTFTVFALPGQIVMVELLGIGASLTAVAIAVWLTNLRLLPMTVALVPLIRDDSRYPKALYFVAAHFNAITGFAIAMQRCPSMPRAERLPFFLGFTMTMWSLTMTGTAIGFVTAGHVPEPVSLGLMFLTPLYFMLVFVEDFRHRVRAIALVAGAVTGPLFYLVSPDWGLLLTGLIAGSAAFAIDRALPQRKP